MGDSSPAMTASMASSSSARPALICALLKQRPALQVTGAGNQVSIAEALTNRGGAARSAVCAASALPSARSLLGDRQQQISLLYAVA